MAYHKSKFNTHHFPVGTIFQLKYSEYKSPDNPEGIYTVQRVVRNGLSSFIVETTTPEVGEIFAPNTFKCFHLLLIGKIIKRGTGPVIVENGYSDDWVSQQIEEISFRINEKKEAVERYTNARLSKNDVVFNADMINDVAWLFNTEENTSAVLDDELMANLFVKSKLGTVTRLPWIGECFIVNKKRFKRWLNQNQNRFYINARKAQSEHDDMIDKVLSEGVDRDFDDHFYSLMDQEEPQQSVG